MKDLIYISPFGGGEGAEDAAELDYIELTEQGF